MKQIAIIVSVLVISAFAFANSTNRNCCPEARNCTSIEQCRAACEKSNSCSKECLEQCAKECTPEQLNNCQSEAKANCCD